MLETREQNQLVIPQIAYSPEIESTDTPYTVSVNPEECTKVLKFLEVPEDRISQLKIGVSKKAPFLLRGIYGAYYHRGKHSISLFTDNLWKRYEICMDWADGIAQREIEPKEGVFRNELYTEKLGNFLSLVDAERGIKVANRLFSHSMQRWFNWMILHELRHVAQFRDWLEGYDTNREEKELEANHFSGDFHQMFPRIAIIEPKAPLGSIPNNL